MPAVFKENRFQSHIKSNLKMSCPFIECLTDVVSLNKLYGKCDKDLLNSDQMTF